MLTLDEANRVIAAALNYAREHGCRVSVSVCDTSGYPIAHQRMDGALPISPHKPFLVWQSLTPTEPMTLQDFRREEVTFPFLEFSPQTAKGRKQLEFQRQRSRLC
jgi:hypothetical protein